MPNNLEQEMIVEDEEADEEDLGGRYLVITEPEDEVVDILSEFSSTLDKARGNYNFKNVNENTETRRIGHLLL